ncbi:beta-ketoacyl-ACP synthase III [Helicobacter sp. 11S02629-2]|uniref:beta-ketoacyl-ACP synthase III n=1 Tax=Helicobacter sp. 11S02629-2 TaxID=1476195 RepID=UPI0015DA389C|nr:beta-ketoacyl-ACP synthase III [Helicobacter sp. 11S02629-2]
MMNYASIKSIASYVPKYCVDNNYFSDFLETDDEWITKRTGIKTRYFASSEEKSSDLGLKASLKALERANLSPKDIDLVICATLSPDYVSMPSTACIIAEKLGLKSTPAFDVSAACTGFIYALSMARAYIQGGVYKNILVVGAEKISSVLDFTDRSTCVLFGDGAGASVISKSEKPGILDVHINSDGSYANSLKTPRLGSKSDNKLLSEILPSHEDKKQALHMNGSEIYRLAVRNITNSAKEILSTNNLEAKDLSYFVPHQANLRIIQAVANALDLDYSKLILTVQKYGNTSAASIPMAINDAYEEGKLSQKGQLILLDAFGGGLTWGSALFYTDF